MFCKIFGHKYPLEIIRCIEPLVIYEFKCKRCKKEFAYHGRVKAFLPLDDELRYANDILLGLKP